MAMLRGIQASHQANGYVDIAYNMAVDQLGNVYECRGLDVIGGATYGANTHTRAVVWMGNSDEAPPSSPACQAIADTYRAGLAAGNLTADATITGHRDWTATACPGDSLYGLLPDIRQRALPATEQDDDMSLTIIPAALRPVTFNGRNVLDLWMSPAGVQLGRTRVQTDVVIVPADPADGAGAVPLTVDVYEATAAGSKAQTVTVPPAGVAVTTVVGGRVAVVFDPARPVLVHGREVHYAA